MLVYLFLQLYLRNPLKGHMRICKIGKITY